MSSDCVTCLNQFLYFRAVDRTIPVFALDDDQEDNELEVARATLLELRDED